MKALEAAPDSYDPDAATLEGFAPDDDLRSTFLSGVPEDQRPDIREEAALNCLATVMIEVFTAGEPHDWKWPSESLQSWAAWRCGLFTNWFHTRIDWGTGTGRYDRLDERLSSTAHKLWTEPTSGPPNSGPAYLFAYGLARRSMGIYAVQAIVTRRRDVEIMTRRPRKQYSTGQRFELKVRVGRRLAALTFYEDHGGSKVVRVPVTPGPWGFVDLSFDLPSIPGRYFIQLVGTEPPPPHGRVLGKPYVYYPIYVGMPEPKEAERFITKEDRSPDIAESSEQDWLDEIFAKYNLERSRAKLPPIKPDRKLRAMGDRLALEATVTAGPLVLAENPFVELAEQGLRATAWAEDLGYAYSPEDYVETQWWSPAVRANVLQRNDWRLGIGIAPFEERGHKNYAIFEYWAGGKLR